MKPTTYIKKMFSSILHGAVFVILTILMTIVVVGCGGEEFSCYDDSILERINQKAQIETQKISDQYSSSVVYSKFTNEKTFQAGEDPNEKSILCRSKINITIQHEPITYREEILNYLNSLGAVTTNNNTLDSIQICLKTKFWEKEDEFSWSLVEWIEEKDYFVANCMVVADKAVPKL